MEGRYGVWRSMRNGDFQEEDVWGFYHESDNTTTGGPLSNSRPSDNVSRDCSRRLPTAPRMIPLRSNRPIMEQRKVVHQSSAPVNIPDWSKIYGKDPYKPSKGASRYEYDGGGDGIGFTHDDDYDRDGDEYAKLPPHEWTARKHASNQMSSFSVFEGVGRTLKGRDLSRVRNAVLTETGFLE